MQPIHDRIRAGEFAFLRTLLEAEPQSLYEREDGDTLLHTAIRSGNIGAVDYLLDAHKELLETADKNGNTPLHVVAQTFWLNAGRDGTIATQLLPKLLLAGASLSRTNKVGQTPLLTLSVRANTQPNWLEAINMLLSAGADPNAKDIDGCTYLHYIARDCEVWSPIPIVDLLLKAGADPSIKNRDFQTPLEICLGKPNACKDSGRQTLIEKLSEGSGRS